MDPSHLSKLIKQRGVLKSQLTRLKTFIEGFQLTNNVEEVRARLRQLPVLREKYDTIQSTLETEDNTGTSDHDEERALFEEGLFEAEGKMELILREDLTENLERKSNSGEMNRSPGSQCGSVNLKLPAISLPSFDGKYEEWLPFSESFKGLVHDNKALVTIQKFHYLLSALRGQAFKLLQNLPITEGNYVVAWELLQGRYENKKLIASTYTRDILYIKAVQRESATELRQFVNTVRSNMNALKAMDLPQSLGDMLVSQLVVDRLDRQTRREWEIKETEQAFPPLSDLLLFLERKSQALENMTPSSSRSNHDDGRTGDSKVNQQKGTKQSGSYVVVKGQKCPFCSNSHPLFKCDAFLATEVKVRRDCVTSNKLCFNCLHPSHAVNKCTSTNCKKCDARHHTLLHVDQGNKIPWNSHQQVAPTAVTGSQETQVPRAAQGSYHAAKHKMAEAHILLSTAIILVEDSTGQLQQCRALLDCGSQSNFVTEDFVQRLNLQKQRNQVFIQGVNKASVEAKHTTTAKIYSSVSNYNASIVCSILPHITGQMPSAHVDSQHWNLPKDIQLADPTFYQPGQIDMLIGAELCFYILRMEKQSRPGDFPVLQNTEFGWILSGKYSDQTPSTSMTSCFIRQETLDQQLQRFWELEEIHTSPKSEEEQNCELHYRENTIRDENGRFVVKLPKRSHSDKLGDSYQQARSRFYQLERKLQRNEELREHYLKFMAEYEDLGHMKEVLLSTDNKNNQKYYLPHHAVFKPSSSTTKTRVVFDGSAKTSNGVSLNDTLMVGPTVQQDLYSIILRFRTHQIVFTADITKMYRQIGVHEDDASLQRIVWRTSPDKPLKTYELVTVTYGTASAPFLATKCLQTLAVEESDKFPRAAEVLQRDFYVDDALCGSSNVKDALLLQEELIALLKRGAFPLRKWCSNHPDLLKTVPPEDREMQFPFDFTCKDSIKTLGLSWHPVTDKFLIANNPPDLSQGRVTKRSVLSIVASIFDPLGLVSPVVIVYKMFLQQLWSHSLQWDDELPDELSLQWQHLHSQLLHLNTIQVDRLVMVKGTPTDIELHGFADASEKAYGCSLYIRSTNAHGTTTVKLLCSRSRVAPVKKVTLPRLELLGAELLSKLLQKTVPILNLKIDRTFLWTDSTIVLAWIASPANRWKTFVANRVAQIQENSSVGDWRHVSSSDNPADLISRGTQPADLAQLALWWHGPHWLRQPSSDWPTDVPSREDVNMPEEKKTAVTALAMQDQRDDLLHRFSNLAKLTRVMAYCWRFYQNANRPSEKLLGPLSTTELQRALTSCIKLVQGSAYTQEIRELASNKQVPVKSSLRDLHAFVDKAGVLRVGGRLRHSQLPYDNKHQIILPPNHHVTELIIKAEHQRLLHAGPQLLIASLRKRYWIPRIKKAVKAIVHNCLTCFRFKVSTSQQLMGQLPSARVQPSRTFLNTGTDFAGPFQIKQGSVRSKITIKCYIAVFICLATKAIHLELVTGLTSEAFIAALRRFTARRGKCLHLYSDNGTNFVGANSELKDLQALFNSEQHQNKLASYAASEEMEWHFIPPLAPHFGGLWEASVKSFKYHFKRVAGNAVLTSEEFTTLLTQIEACLNSRPITVLSNDPSDPSYLSPGHFLIGAPLMSYPEPSLSDLTENRLSRWQRVQKLYEQLWQRWSTDYLNSLQQRGKWTSPQSSLQPGMVVLVKEDRRPPLEWPLAVITETFPGKDGHVRVAAIRTSSGVFKRPITKLVPLPYEHSTPSN